MLKTHCAILGRLAPVLVLFSCAPSKTATIETPAPVQGPVTPPAEVPAVAETPAPVLPEDDFRLPDMLGMPGEGEFRSSALTSSADAGTVIARPPTEPPPRLKPQEGE